MRGLILGLVLAQAAAVQCCNPQQHATYEQQALLDAKTISLCEARGGVPLVEVKTDENAHQFRVIKSCSFPCGDVKLKGEGELGRWVTARRSGFMCRR